MKRNEDRPCERCGTMFHPYRRTLRFCSNACASQAQYQGHSREAECVVCGKAFISRNKDNGKGRHWTRCCGRSCAGKLAGRGGAEASRLRRRYGIEPDEYDALLHAQRGVCALCGKPKDYRLYVDHDHATGRVRALLCARCNTAAGVFDELDAEGIARFWKYTRQS